MSFTLERNAWNPPPRTDAARPGEPVAIGDFLPEVLETLLANPRTEDRGDVLRASPRARTSRRMRLVG